MGQRPIGEIAYRVLSGLFLQLHGGGIDRDAVCDAALFFHQAQHHARAADGGIDIGGGGIAAGRLDQTGDDRRFGGAEVGRRMAEEFAAGAVDPVGSATEIDLVQIKLEDLLLREFPFERHRQHRFAQFAVERAVGIEEHVARKLLRNRGGAADPLVPRHAFDDRTRQAHRIDAEMRLEALILDRDHRILHHLRYFGGIEPFAEARAQFHDLAAIARAHDDGLADLSGLQLIEAGQRSGGKGNRQCGEEQHEQNRHAAADHQPPHPQRPVAWLFLGTLCRCCPIARAASAASAIVASRQNPSPVLTCDPHA